MADVDIDPFGEHESRTEEPTDENIPLSVVGHGGTPSRQRRINLGTNTRTRNIIWRKTKSKI